MQRNTDIYREVFGCYPDSKMICTSEVSVVRKKADIKKYDDLKDEITGYAVEFPLDFLSSENLKKMKHFEFGLYILPHHIFT